MSTLDNYTKDQWNLEMAEAKANGCQVMSYEDWIDYRSLVDDLFDELTKELQE